MGVASDFPWAPFTCDARPFGAALVVPPAFLLTALPPSEDRTGDCPSPAFLVGEACPERAGLDVSLPRLEPGVDVCLVKVP
jgi:hypothetical protein